MLRVLTQINGMDVWLLRTARAFRQAHVLVTTFERVVKRFESRCGRTEYNGDIELARTVNGDVTRGIAKAILLFVGTVVFLVNDNEAGTG